MTDPYRQIFRRHSRLLEPIPTGEQPVLKRIEGLRAVLFDVYGTLLISASGEVGTATARTEGVALTPQRALAGALRAMDISTSQHVGESVEYYFQAIEASHAQSRAAGIDYPEVDVVEVWRDVLAELARRGLAEEAACRDADPRRLAVEYEVRVNPCWPMPHLRQCLCRLRDAPLVLGIISNAQFYTGELLEVLLEGPAEKWGFPRDLQYFSYHHGVAKPGLALFEMAERALQKRRIEPREVLYVGNDMLNDILPAGKLGFHTALFAGDARSFRPRDGDGRLEGVSPDVVLTELGQLGDCAAA